MRRLHAAGIRSLSLIFLAAAQAQPAEPPPVLPVGVTRCYAERAPLDGFNALYPQFRAGAQPFVRNPWGAYDNKPLPRTHGELPAVFAVYAGRGSNDLPILSGRDLIEPVEPLLEAAAVRADDFLPAVRAAAEAVYDPMPRAARTVWAVPHHVVMDTLHYRREAFPEGAPRYDSWEELFEAAAAQRGDPAAGAIGFSAPMTLFELAECLALSAGMPPVDYADPVAWKSPELAAALEMVESYRARGAIALRQRNVPLRRAGNAVLGYGFCDSVHPSAPFGLLPLPDRLRKGDPPAARSTAPMLLECYAFKSYSPEMHTATRAFASWLLGAEADWNVFEATNQRAPDAEWVIDMVHVPLRPALLASVDFEYALKKYPEYALLADWVRRGHVPDAAPEIDAALRALADRVVDFQIGRDPVPQLLDGLYRAAVEKIAATPVESAAYDAY